MRFLKVRALTTECNQTASWKNAVRGAVVAAAFMLFAGQNGARAAELQDFIALKYEVRLNGIPVAELHVDAAVGNHSYDISSTMWTRGLMDLILGFKSYARAQGRIGKMPGGPVVRPESHSDDNTWMEEERRVNIVYGPKGPKNTRVSPSPADEGRDEVSANLRHDTQDLLSAALKLSLSASNGTICQSRAQIFDGRRRYDLIFSPGKVEDTALGSNIHCDGKLVRLAGRSSESWLPRSKVPKEFQFWVNEVDPGLPPVPYRLKAFANIGWIVVELENYSREQRAEVIVPADETSG